MRPQRHSTAFQNLVENRATFEKQGNLQTGFHRSERQIMGNQEITDNRMYWYNFVTCEHEYIETPTDFTSYISQETAAQGLYRAYLQMGDTPADAAIKVLRACVGEKVIE